MNAEMLRRRALPSLKPVPTGASQYEPLMDQNDTAEPKSPRVLTRALRSLSSSSLDSVSGSAPRRSTSSRRLHKTPSNSSTMMERLHIRASRDSNFTVPPSPDAPGTPLEQPFYSMELVHSGHLKTDVSLLKARSEYLVLTDQCLVKFGSVEAARGVFPQLNQPEPQSRRGSQSSLSGKAAVSEIRFEIPLRSIVAVFNEDTSSSHRSNIEIWWFSQSPRLAYCRARLCFSLPQEKDQWLATIHGTCRAKLRRSPLNTSVPDNLRVRFDHIVANNETQFDGTSPNLIFPVARRLVGSSQKSSSNEDPPDMLDGSSFFFVIGPCMCYLVEVLRADFTTPARDLRVKYSHFGTVTLTKFRASVASHEQRFAVHFRSPFGHDARIDLASIHYRRIIEALTRVDRVLKPMWPQQFQQIIFDIKGLPPPLQLTSGNDLGGVEMSLQAHCAAFHVDMPRWTVDWHASYRPEFRLLPLHGAQYSPLQLMAVFRALRYNSFFKAISFRDVDLSPLSARKDHSPYGEGVVYSSLNGCKISEEHYEDLLQAPVLSQEFHALAFASESIRSIDLSNCLGMSNKRASQIRTSTDTSASRRTSSEILRPIFMLARAGICTIRNIIMSGNPMSQADIDELANLSVLDHVSFRKIEVAGCGLGDAGLNKLWSGLAGQACTLQTIDTSDNQGVARFDTLRQSLNQLQILKKLNIAGNTRLDPDVSLFDEAAIHSWALTELDLSGIVLNEATVDVLAGYLETDRSDNLQVLRLNKCGLTGKQIAKLFWAMGPARKVDLHANCSLLDEGINDLCSALADGYGPWSLFLQMVEFNLESSYIKLWEALTVNKTIECLSLAGSSIPDAASPAACATVSRFFSGNDAVRFLDISGYNAKLDEGRLGKDFSSSLGGMRDNTRIEHLRVRNQMLNVNIGDLAEAISGNKVLHTLDCEDNGFNLSNFRHLIKHLGDNMTIRHFSAFTPQELERSVRKSVSTAGAATPTRRASIVSRLRHERTPSGDKGLVQHLKDEWDSAVAELGMILERNQRLFEESLHAEDGEDTATPLYEGPREGEGTFSQAFGGLAFKEYEARRTQCSSGSATPTRKPSAAGSTTSMSEMQGLGGRLDLGVTRSSSTASSEVALSPTSASSSTSPMRTPPEGESPRSKFSPRNADGAFDYSNMGEYVHIESPQADDGLQMKMYRRTWGDSVSRIEEEDDVVCAA